MLKKTKGQGIYHHSQDVSIVKSKTSAVALRIPHESSKAWDKLINAVEARHLSKATESRNKRLQAINVRSKALNISV